MQNDQLVVNLKASISEKADGLAIGRLKLVYKGRTMQDKSLIGDYNLEEGCKVHLILQKEGYSNPPSSSVNSNTSLNFCSNTTNRLKNEQNNFVAGPSTSSSQTNQSRPQSRFESILRERLAEHFAPNAVERIMANLQHEIDVDINSSSLDDLERLAKQKLNISNE